MPSWNMSGERFQLLSTFKAIYDYGGISAAARNLNMTQSAVSKHLQKLRHWFGEELFVRTAKGMEPTTKADELIENVERVLFELENLGATSHFEPAKLTGTFTIATTSEICQQLSSELLKLLQNEAPNLRLTFINLSDDYALKELETGKVNMVISVNWHAPDVLMQKRLFSDRFAVLMNQSNPLSDKALTIQDYVNAPHILVAPLGQTKGYIDNYILAKNFKRHVRLSVPDFSVLDTQLLDDKHIITLPHRIALGLSHKMPLSIKQLPFNVPAFDYYMFWHKRFTKDQTHLWLREHIDSILC